jgi:hypothetical protein
MVLKHLAAAVREREWLTMAQLAEHGGFTTAEAARKFVTRHRDLPHARVGRTLRVDRATFDRYIAEAGNRTSSPQGKRFAIHG